MTREELGITHILKVSPRGFRNEVTILPITHEYLRLAEERASRAEDDVNSWGALYAWDNAPTNIRKRAGLVIRNLSVSSDECGSPVSRWLEGLLTEFFDPAAEDDIEYRNGQWVRTSEAVPA